MRGCVEQIALSRKSAGGRSSRHTPPGRSRWLTALLCTLLLATPAFADDARPTLWSLSIGVSDYQDPDLKLTFADDDARAVASALEEQANRRVYGAIESRVLLNRDVTRESILTGIRELIANAGEEDVALIFMAGHGVRDLLTGTYYFLPHTATPDDFFTQGLRVEELNDMVRILQRHVRHVVIILDTCHSGAVDLQATQMASADDFAARVRSDGVFLLAATRPGDKSKEIRRLGHGVFTYALLNALQGAANAGSDGLLSLAELVIYLGEEVPRLTAGKQTPYYLIAGTDLVLADVRAPNAVVVFPFRNQNRADSSNDWMSASLQQTFHHELDRLPVLNTCAPPESRPAERDARAQAQRLGCGAYIDGSFVVDRASVEIYARVGDAGAGTEEVTASVRGKRADFAKLKRQLVRDLLGRMPTVRAYQMMLEAQGIGPPEIAPEPTPASDDRQSWLRIFSFTSTAYAQDTARADASPATDDAILNVLRAYEQAHEEKQIDTLARLWTDFTERQQDALRRYFDQAGDLTLELADVAIEPHDAEATVAYTRVVRFVDRESRKPVRIEVPQRMILVRTESQWKIKRIESR